jgi:tRNA threonylcarbamoyladenosine biosynthesis protein TsaB
MTSDERRMTNAINSSFDIRHSTLLAIDTCTRRASIALRDATMLHAEMTWECERHHTAAVSAKIHELMQTSKIAPGDIGAVAVAIGPGSFTGVRCGLAIGKGFAMANDLPVLGVTAFDVIAQAQPNRRKPVYAVVEAGRKRVAYCRYGWAGDELTVASEWQVVSLEEFAAQVHSPAYVCGDVGPLLANAALSAQLRAHATLAPAWLNARRAGVLAELAYARWQRGEVDDVDTLMPIYPPEN